MKRSQSQEIERIRRWRADHPEKAAQHARDQSRRRSARLAELVELVADLRLEVAELRLLVERLRPAQLQAIGALPLFERDRPLPTEAVPFP